MSLRTSDSTASPAASHLHGWEAAWILALTLLLAGIGLQTLSSASLHLARLEGVNADRYLIAQFQGVVAGSVLMFLLWGLNYRRLRRAAPWLLGATLLLLLVMLLPGMEWLVPSDRGVRRWVRLGGMSLQPSEFAKLVLLIWTASALPRKEGEFDSFTTGTLPFLMVWGAGAVLIALAPSVSAAALTLLLALSLGLVGGIRIRHLLLPALLASAPAWFFVTAAEYRVRRLTAFRDPLAHAARESYQVVQALTAIGAGGLLGRGPGQSQMRSGFIPEPHNDFAVAVFAEEWGFVGLSALLFAYIALALLAIRIALRTADPFGRNLALGMALLLTLPALLHMAVALSLVPPTGVGLPFVSYGRSNLLVCFMAVGILLSVASKGARRRELRGRLHMANKS